MLPFAKYWWNRPEIEIVSAVSEAEVVHEPLDQSSDNSLILDNIDLSMLFQDLEDSVSRQKTPYKRLLATRLEEIAEDSLIDELETIFDVESMMEKEKISAQEPKPKPEDTDKRIIVQSEVESERWKAVKSPYLPCSRLAVGAGSQHWAFRYELEIYKTTCTNFPLYYKWLVYCSQGSELSVNSLTETTLDLKLWFKNNISIFEDIGLVVKIIKLGVSPRKSHDSHKKGVSLDLKVNHTGSQKLFKELTTMALTGTLANYGSNGNYCTSCTIRLTNV